MKFSKLIKIMKAPWGISIVSATVLFAVFGVLTFYVGRGIGHKQGYDQGVMSMPALDSSEVVPKSEYDILSKNYFDLLDLYNGIKTEHEHQHGQQSSKNICSPDDLPIVVTVRSLDTRCKSPEEI